MVRSSDPTYYADPGQTLDDAAKAAVAVRLIWLSFGGRRVRLKDGETAAELAARFDKDAVQLEVPAKA